MAQPPARKRPKPQIVVPLHERIPAPALIGAGEPYLDLTDHYLGLVQRIGHALVIDDALRKSQPPASPSDTHRLAASVK